MKIIKTILILAILLTIIGGCSKTGEATQPIKGTLSVTTTPASAPLYVDGVLKGKTPLNTLFLPGVYSVSIKKQGYEEYNTSVTITSKETTTINAVLTQATTGSLQVKSTPSQSDIYVGTEYKGFTPSNLILPVGVHTVKITKVGYQDYKTSVTVKGGQTGLTVNAILNAVPNNNGTITGATTTNSSSVPPQTGTNSSSNNTSS